MNTAVPNAVVRAEEANRPIPLFADPFASLFGASHPVLSMALTFPFFRDAVRLRTRFIDDAIRDALASGGVRQVVLLGAGFDTRALRMPEIAACGARVFEVDTAAQLDQSAPCSSELA